jgi:hypothetical protein
MELNVFAFSRQNVRIAEPAAQGDRRRNSDRRHPTLVSYWIGGVRPRRRDGRRSDDRIYPVIDWHHPRILVPALLIFFLCVADAFLTVTLIHHGAIEANPVMATLLDLDIRGFTGAKLLLTAAGTFVLVACSRMRLFRRLPGEALLNVVALAYVVLIGYELHLLGNVSY